MCCPGKLDAKLSEFWVSNPWDIVRSGQNLSCFERNRLFLNVSGRDFLDVSYITGTDSDGDGRAAIAADFRNVGKMDLLVRQEGGGALLLWENSLAVGHYLKVSLRGQRSNRLGIGARLVAYVGDRAIVRELYPVNSYLSQMPSLVHFGLGDAERIDRLTVRWPSGCTQEFSDLSVDRHLVITEDTSADTALTVVTPGTVIDP